MTTKGAIAAGHPETARAAAIILDEGGNAFDAVLAAIFAACVAEPVLTSLGGGGFLLARPGDGEAVLYDFFAQTPKIAVPEGEVEFVPIIADFGTAQQEFHIGMGAMATPGMVKGLFRAHADLGTMPMARIIEPAVHLARGGFVVNRLQAYIFSVVKKIYTSNARCRATFGSRRNPDHLIGEGETFFLPAFADILEALAREGEDLFYRGDIAHTLIEACRNGGGLLTASDLAGYRVELRQPLELRNRDVRLLTNPPPSTGGILIAFALELLKGAGMAAMGFGSAAHLELLARAMDLTNRARVESRLHENDADDHADTMLDPRFLETYRREILGRPTALSGTTHISVIDARGNAAALTASNGEGSGYLVPDTGIMMNNLLGEEDINPHGFHQWPPDTRLCSMMAPTLVAFDDDAIAAMGSGGSNRIRTAILQVLLNLLEFGMGVRDAVESPRIHFENGLLSVEAGFDAATVEAVARQFPRIETWEERNLFFGGVHSVLVHPCGGRFEGAGDPRRGGVAVTV
jgi:gamma-glutamyltranspeptidase/glutathione hydrolase